MKNSKKIIITLLILLSMNVGLFAKTTYVHTSYYDNGANPLFNDIYSSLVVSSSYLSPVLTTDSEEVSKIGANFNGSVFFMDAPVGMYYSLDFVPMDTDVYLFDVMFGLAIRNQMSPLVESYVNLGPAVSIISEMDDSVLATPYTLIYWGGALNAGYRISLSQQVQSVTLDVGATAKALWYDPYTSENASSLSVEDFRYSVTGYVGITFRWFAPDWDKDDVNVILAL